MQCRPLLALNFIVLMGSLSPVFASECQLQSSQLVQDFGQFNPYELATTSESGRASVGQRFIQLNVTCPQPTRMAILFRGTAVDPESFKMGENGSFNLIAKDALVDGRPVNLGRVLSGAAMVDHGTSSVKMAPGYYVVPLAQNGTRLEGQAFSIRVEINAYLKSDQLKIRDVTPFQGQAFFELDTGIAVP
ncbi:hypothetical protein [Pseudomonas sp. Sample_22]|uniref:hypothetical protein n=1 Tax=Pseudomonas sp. Sample_22 TaxID=2448266 RepID=UPI0010328814|nr:hypothetical protein [Pseudomonas sp. Sample_22]